MHPHLASALIAAVVAGLVGLGVVNYAPKPAKPNTVTVVAPPGTSLKSVSRAAAAAWGELEQAEVDALTALLKPVAEKTPVVIFCLEESKCGDMALDFENAFESAKWPVAQERPLADDTVGIGTSDANLAALIEQATAGRLKPKAISANMKDRVALVIGKKPKQ